MTNKRKFYGVYVNYVRADCDELEFEVDDWKEFLRELIDCGGIEKEDLEEFIEDLFKEENLNMED